MSDGASAKFEGWDALGSSLERAIAAIDNQRAIETVVVESAAPMVEDIRSQIGTWRPWRERGFTRQHIHASPAPSSSPGEARVEIGARPGPNVTLRMLEKGTSKLPAQAPMRKAYDAHISGVRARIIEGLKRIWRF